jgi:hypothetical protein
MYRPAQKHPLSSFRFWFLVLGCVAATTAWKMGWLPNKSTQPVAQTEEVNFPDAEPGAAVAPVDPRAAALEANVLTAQSEPAVEAAPVPEASPAVTPPVATGATAPAAHSGNPFGPANPEFVPADTFARKPEAAPTPGAQRFPADPGMIQQVSAVEGGAPVTAAAVISGDAPIDFPQPQVMPQIDWNEIDRMINAGQDVEAHRTLSSLYWERPDQRQQIRERIEQTAMRIYFQPQPHYLDPHVVQGGDLLQTIARAHNVSWQYLAKLNRTDPLRIRPGQNLKVIDGPFGAVVDLRRFELTVHAHGYFVARFPIGIGKDGATPVGEFRVEDKLENPTYYGPDGVVAADDPQNPLGEFWMSIGGGYGIHGTIDEATIGRAESRGCLRLKNQDIADLYDLLVVGSPVVIRR